MVQLVKGRIKMKRKLLVIFLCIILTTFITACKAGNKIESEQVDVSILLNDGSAFVYTFKDSNTGVWYICTSSGVTPRLNEDGTLYCE